MSGGFEPDAWAVEIGRRLGALGTPDRSEAQKRYLKSDLEHFGVRVPDIRRVTRTSCREAGIGSRQEVTALASALWAAPIHECRMAAVEVLVHFHPLLAPGDAPLLEELLREARTWAFVDPLAAGVAGRLFDAHPAEMAPILDRWATDGDFWIRRAALLALLPGLRAGAGDFERFGRYADAMLDEKEFFIRKAIGWVLRESGRTTPDRVADWLGPRTHRASGVTMREAVKPLPPARAAELMEAYREARPSR